jgi:hypothetical protein
MRRSSLIILAVGCLCAPITGMAQQSGGTGNRTGTGMSVGAGAPTLEEYIEFTRREIAQARADKTISPHKAARAEHRLEMIEHKLDVLNKDVSDLRHSIH